MSIAKKISSKNFLQIRIKCKILLTKRETQYCCGSIFPNSRKLAEQFFLTRKLTAKIVHNNPRGCEHIASTTIIPKSRIVRKKFFPGSARKMKNSWKALQKSLVIHNHATHLRLL